MFVKKGFEGKQGAHAEIDFLYLLALQINHKTQIMGVPDRVHVVAPEDQEGVVPEGSHVGKNKVILEVGAVEVQGLNSELVPVEIVDIKLKKLILTVFPEQGVEGLVQKQEPPPCQPDHAATAGEGDLEGGEQPPPL